MTYEKIPKELIYKFLNWELPESVCVDHSATVQGQKGRTGTNLLSYEEARKMLEHLFPDGIQEERT